jgi:hypothetical protein
MYMDLFGKLIGAGAEHAGKIAETRRGKNDRNTTEITYLAPESHGRDFRN